jgi:hypothetical protein
MENGADTFSLQSSEIITLPLDTSLVFSTNLPLSGLMDEAYLRRITYKIPVRTPTKEEFRLIAGEACISLGIEANDAAVNVLVERLYSLPNVEPKSCYARDLIQTVLDAGTYHGRPARLDETSIDWALELYLGDRGRAPGAG